jgi:F-type H+-transporting ATPase subunit a
VAHFSWLQLIPGVGHEYVHVAAAILVTLLIVLFSLAGRLALGTGEAAIAPAGQFSIKGFFEVLVEFINTICHMVLGEEGNIFIPLFGAIFFYILFSNMIGLIPGLSASTSNMNTALAVGLFSFAMYNILGVKYNGLSYFKHFLGPIWWLAPLLLPIELISHLVRPMSLGLRLSGNMTGDHTVLGIFLSLTPYGIPVIFYFLGLFVCFVQAFVFTLLSMIYVMMATAHDH